MAVDITRADEAQDIETPSGVAYVYRLGESLTWKLGKTTNLKRREKTFQTIQPELVLYAEIQTTNHTEVENFLKAQLQGYRLDGPGKDLYRANEDVVDAAIEAARRFSAETLSRLSEAEELSGIRADGRVLTPTGAQQMLYRELLEARQKMLLGQQDMDRIRAELMLTMGTASELQGIATFESQDRNLFDAKRFQDENPLLAAPYMTKKHVRSFCPRW